METKNKVRVYIDGANMLYTQKKLGWNIDWRKLVDYLRSRWDITEVRYYTGVKEGDEKMAGFLKYLNHLGIVTVTKTLKIIKIGPEHPLFRVHHYRELHKSNFDVEMTTDILMELLKGKDNNEHIKQVVIASGDSDFNYLIKMLRAMDVGTIIAASKKMLAWELKFSASEIIKIEDLREEIEKK